MVKQASKLCSKMINENSELSRLTSISHDLLDEIDEAVIYMDRLTEKMKDMTILINRLQEAPEKL